MDLIPKPVLDNLRKAIPNIKKYAKFLAFLANDANPRYIQIMAGTLKQGINCFIETVSLLVNDIEKSVNDDEFKKLMVTLWDNHLVKVKDSKNTCLDLQLLIKNNENL
jgi:hypothetical protein